MFFENPMFALFMIVAALLAIARSIRQSSLSPEERKREEEKLEKDRRTARKIFLFLFLGLVLFFIFLFLIEVVF